VSSGHRSCGRGVLPPAAARMSAAGAESLPANDHYHRYRENVALMRDNVRVAVPVIDTPEYGTAAETATREQNAGYITVILENGCAASDVVAEDGRVDDSDRVMFLFAWGTATATASA
jgi:beta-glucosidase/6-phospho-beta-glucosidase/beta-galactosidase